MASLSETLHTFKLCIPRSGPTDLIAGAIQGVHDLQDHPSVHSHPCVKGPARNVFFWAHNHPEGGSNDESKSKFNTEEAEMAVRLVRHLLLQACSNIQGVVRGIAVQSCSWLVYAVVAVTVSRRNSCLFDIGAPSFAFPLWQKQIVFRSARSLKVLIVG